MVRKILSIFLSLTLAQSASAQINLGSQVKGTLPVTNGGTGTTTATGAGAVVKGTSPTIATPVVTNPTITTGTWDAKSSAQFLDRSNHTGTEAAATNSFTASGRVLGRVTAGAGGGEELTAAQVKSLLAIAAADVSGLGTAATSASTAFAAAAHVGSGGTAHSNVVAAGASGFMTGTDKTKLDGIATGATANSSDATLLSRANHIGQQSITTLSDIPAFSMLGNPNGTLGAVQPIDFVDLGNMVPTFNSLDNGTVPASGGGTVNFLRADGTWATPPGGGGGVPGGSTTQIQYNSAGAFAGSANLVWNNASGILDVTGVVELGAVAAEPAVPATDNGRLYAKNIAGRVVPKWMGPSGVDYPLQSHLGQNNIRIWRGGATAVATTFASTIGSMPYTGASPTAPTIPALATTSIRNQTVRSTISTGATAGGIAYIRGNQATITRGNAASIGGFYVLHRFSLSTLQAGQRAFAGIVDVAANPTNIDPLIATTPGGVGMAINTNSGNWNLVHNATGTARTVVGLGATFPVNNTDMLELALYSPPNGASIGYRVTNLSSGAQVSGSLSTNIPANTTFLAPTIWVTNNATAAAATLDFVSTYVETDF